jgi:hypothetical protein
MAPLLFNLTRKKVADRSNKDASNVVRRRSSKVQSEALQTGAAQRALVISVIPVQPIGFQLPVVTSVRVERIARPAG